MQSPIDIEIIVQIMPHKGFTGKLGGHELIEESNNLIAIHRTIQIWSDSREIDSFAQVIVATVLQALQKDCDTILRSRSPVFVDQPPKIVRKGVFFTEIKIDHR